MIDLVRVGGEIASLRLKNQLSQDQLAAKLLVSRQAVSAWEMGKSAPSIDNVIELSKVFSVSFEDILCLDDEPRLEQNDIFAGHNREFLLREICEGKVKCDISKLFYECTGFERIQILKAVKAGKISLDGLSPNQLTDEEKEYLKKGGLSYEH